jgi:hypothetical protein
MHWVYSEQIEPFVQVPPGSPCCRYHNRGMYLHQDFGRHLILYQLELGSIRWLQEGQWIPTQTAAYHFRNFEHLAEHPPDSSS